MCGVSLRQAWAAKDALESVMEVERGSLLQRLQDLEGDLSSGRAERDQLAEVPTMSPCSGHHTSVPSMTTHCLIRNFVPWQALYSIEQDRDKWKTTCMSTSQGLEGVLDERDELKQQLQLLAEENKRLRAGASMGQVRVSAHASTNPLRCISSAQLQFVCIAEIRCCRRSLPPRKRHQVKTCPIAVFLLSVAL